MTYKELNKKIKSKKEIISDETLRLFTNYFFVLIQKKAIPFGVEIDELIDNAFLYAENIEFYDEEHWVCKKNGSDTKGFRDPENKTIFIRKNLPEPLREIIAYHELHHAAQTNPENEMVGIWQEDNVGRMIMEAQTQWFAEEVYKFVHNVQFVEKEIPSDQLRMLGGGTVISSLHNYEMYDSMLTKLSILIGMPKEFFVSINFLYKEKRGLKLLEETYNVSKEKYKLKYDFKNMLAILDYIYCVDYKAYIDGPDKSIILNGSETSTKYIISTDYVDNLSQKKQKAFINDFDNVNFLSLIENGGDFSGFAKYILDDQNRQLIQNCINSILCGSNTKA